MIQETPREQLKSKCQDVGQRPLELAKILKQEKRNGLEAFVEEVGVEFSLDGPWQHLKGLKEVEENVL